MRTSDVFSPPPSHSARFRSDHLDEIHAFIAAYDGSHRRAALGRDAAWERAQLSAFAVTAAHFAPPS